MKKTWCSIVTFCFILTTAHSQTLFTYGNYSVSAKEFMRAFEKNNTAPANERQKAMREYLDLYIASRLKIREAYDRGLDTLPQQREEIASLRSQIISSYLTDPAQQEKLVLEAFRRSQKDIHVAHIFVPFQVFNGKADTMGAGQLARQLIARMKKGESFSKVAKEFSADPSAKLNGGDMGFITVFSLPYEIENVIYNTAVGNVSLHKSKAGYHILKNLAERKALGRVKAQQILLAFPPDADAGTINTLQRRADSLHSRLSKGDDFSKLAIAFSNDFISAAAKGEMPEFGVGEYEPAFEKIVFNLQDKQISKPFRTSHGIHILKRISRTPIPASSNEKTLNDLRNRVQQNDRIRVIDENLAAIVINKLGLSEQPFNREHLWLATDSALDFKKPQMPVTINGSSVLYYLAQIPLTASDWFTYAQNFRTRRDGQGLRPYNEVLEDFVKAFAHKYYRDHLEEFNPAFRDQLNEFVEGNLFFEIMQQKVWSHVQDTVALVAVFNKNPSRYDWKQSADAVIFFGNNPADMQAVANQLRVNPTGWRLLADAMAQKVVADSGRFEWSQIPGLGNAKPRPGTITEPVVSKTDNATSFAYIVNVYTQASPRTFEQARGLVINDYQDELEKKWMADLRAKYPVKINEDVLRTLK